MHQIKTTLYALNKDGSYQQWKVFTDGEKVIVEFGKLDGKLQYKETVCTPKNVGRANETTAEQQAELEAISKWEKQVRLGYVENMEDCEQGVDLLPMLVHDYLKRGKALKLPCWILRKLDGLRLLVVFQNGEPKFISRGNKSYPIQGKLLEQLRSFHSTTGIKQLDGELYIHGLPLQKIVSLAKRWRTQEEIQAEIDKDYEADKKRRHAAIKSGLSTYKNFNKVDIPVDVEPVRDDLRYGGYCSYDLEYHIFDIPSDKVWWDPETESGRCKDLMDAEDTVTTLMLDHIKVVDAELAYTVDHCEESVGIFMSEGYEGTIMRNFCGKYEYGQRTSEALKWKKFNDAEVKVIDVEKDKNDEGVLICVDKEGIVVKMKMKGTHEERSYDRMQEMIGKFVTFKYQARTEDNNYQFPVGICVRNVNPDTWEVLE